MCGWKASEYQLSIGYVGQVSGPHGEDQGQRIVLEDTRWLGRDQWLRLIDTMILNHSEPPFVVGVAREVLIELRSRFVVFAF